MQLSQIMFFSVNMSIIIDSITLIETLRSYDEFWLEKIPNFILIFVILLKCIFHNTTVFFEIL